MILEIKAGEGGQESALFAGDLLRMYLRYAERRGWMIEVLDTQDSDLGGVKDVSVAIKTQGRARRRLRRVVPAEVGGRRAPRAAGAGHRVAGPHPHLGRRRPGACPRPRTIEVEIDPSDMRIDVFRSSGPGGQSVNTTDSAVRITHLPTGIVVELPERAAQLQNKDRAMRMLRARLLAAAEEQADAAASDARKAQVRTVDRSERIRTYNFPQNRITDHRIGYTAYNLDLVLGGDLDAVLDALAEADRAARLAGETELSRRA